MRILKISIFYQTKKCITSEMQLHFKHISHLFTREKNKFSQWVGYAGLCIGILLLLLAVQMFFNIQKMITEEAPRKSGGYDFVSVSKTITNDNMGKDNRFTTGDIKEMEVQPEIAAVAPLNSNQFRARATAGDILPFTTDLFLESLNNNFIDTLPPTFTWKPGQQDVPIIFSSDFLEIYNVFAPAQGLPQLSPKTISSVNIFLECSGARGSENFRASIVALSDRVNSILVPESFLKWGNINLAGDTSQLASRVYIKTKDANDPLLIKFLDNHQYHINKDKIRFGRVKGVLQNTIGIIGGFGILVIALALVLFGFYLKLMIARSKENIKLLLMLGYSPKWLSQNIIQNRLPAYVIIIITALLCVSVIQFIFSKLAFLETLSISPWIHWATLLSAILMLAVSFYFNTKMVDKEIRALGKGM